jgi:hypothetical protein
MAWTVTTVKCPRCGGPLNIGHSDITEDFGTMVISNQECDCWLEQAEINGIVLQLRAKTGEAAS